MKNQTEALAWRYAVKQFDSKKKVPQETVELILDAARHAPTSFGLQPFHITVVQDQALREKLRAVSWNQSQITDCSHLLVFQAESEVNEKLVADYVKLTAETRGVDVAMLGDFHKMMVGAISQKPGGAAKEWAIRQAYIAMGFALFSAALHEVDSCPMEGVTGPEYDKILESSRKLETIAVVALGYRSSEDKFARFKKVRQPKEKFITRR